MNTRPATLAVLAAGGAALAQAPLMSGFITETYCSGLVNTSRPSFAADGTLYIGREDNGAPVRVWRVPPGGGAGQSYGAGTFRDPDVVLVDRAGQLAPAGSLLVGERCDETHGCVWAILADESVIPIHTFSIEFLNPEALRFDPRGRLLIGDVAASMNRVAALDAGVVSPLFPVATGPVDIHIGADGLVYTLSGGGTVRIHDLDGTLINDAYVTGVGANGAIAFGPGDADWGADLYILTNPGELWRVAPGGVRSVVGSGFPRSRGMTFGPDDALYISVPGEARVMRVAPCGVADFNADSLLNIFDFLDYQTAFAEGDPSADLTAPFGVLNVFDFLAFQSIFGTGC